MSAPRVVTVLVEDHLVTLTRAIGLIRRRNFPVHSLAVGPTDVPGVSRLTIMMQSDQATAERAAQLNDWTDELNAALAAGVEEEGAVFVDVTDRFRGHGVGSADPWILFGPDAGTAMVRIRSPSGE